MKKVRLYTSTGAKPTIDLGGFVVEGEIPPFNIPPEVLMWGARLFVFVSTEEDTGVYLYREAFAVALVSLPGQKGERPMA